MPEIDKGYLLVVSHVQHYFWQGKIWAFGPYVLEIDIWADLFPSILISSPYKNSQPPGDCLPFTHQNITMSPVEIRGQGEGFFAKFERLVSLPSVIWKLGKVMKKAWAIHVRLPGNLGAIGALLAPLYSKRIVAKYAGTWPNFAGEPFSYRFQKSILKSKWFKGPVTVYGDWPDQPPHIVPFFTSILTDDQIEMARVTSQNRQIHSPARILFVGRMDRGKNAHILIDAISVLKQSWYETAVRIIGDGNENDRLRELVSNLQISNLVEFTGAIPFDQVLEQYEWGDILVLLSENAEGWPKAISEGMAFGLVCFGSQRGLIPQMLGDGRGIVIDPLTSGNLSDRIKTIIDSPENYSRISRSAAEWSKAYSLDGLREAIKSLLQEKWHLGSDLFKLTAGKSQ